MTWYEARDFCLGHNGKLVEVYNAEQMQIVQDFVETYPEPRPPIWLGLTDLETTGRWVWHSTVTVTAYTKWHDGEPSYPGIGQCARIEGNKWNAAECWSLRYDPIALCQGTPPCRVEPGYDYDGSNISGKSNLTVASVDQCALWCSQEAACNVWTFNSKNSKCFLKTSDGGRLPDAASISGTKECGDGGGNYRL